MSTSNNNTTNTNISSLKLQPKGSSYIVPPVVVGSSFRLFGYSLWLVSSWFVASIVGIIYFLAVPFPEDSGQKIAVAVFLIVGIGIYLVAPLTGLGGRTGLEWTVARIAFRRSNLPRVTRARPITNWQQFTFEYPDATAANQTKMVDFSVDTPTANWGQPLATTVISKQGSNDSSSNFSADSGGQETPSSNGNKKKKKQFKAQQQQEEGL